MSTEQLVRRNATEVRALLLESMRPPVVPYPDEVSEWPLHPADGAERNPHRQVQMRWTVVASHELVLTAYWDRADVTNEGWAWRMTRIRTQPLSNDGVVTETNVMDSGPLDEAGDVPDLATRVSVALVIVERYC